MQIMGGYGSGSWWRNTKKATTDNYLRLSISYLLKKGFITPNHHSAGTLRWSWLRTGEVAGSIGYTADMQSSSATLTLQYTHGSGEEKEALKYDVALTTTPHYGGVRWWFICPVSGCGKRVAMLYGGRFFACRSCHGLTYRSQQESVPFRLLSQSQNIHYALGGDGCEAGDCPPRKPKGMHWKTYNRKVAKMKRYYYAANASMMQRLGSAYM